MVVVIDYGMGNLGSVLNMLRRSGADAEISSDPKAIAAAQKLILPGVGSFDQGMSNLASRGLIPLLNERVLHAAVPILGICLGMQLFTRSSEEGNMPGLGWIEADTKRFNFPQASSVLKIPHMGWNSINVKHHGDLLHGFADPPRFYFVHSYYVVCANPQDVLATTFHGLDFASVIRRGNIAGTQFHPEKSHKYGITLFKNFMSHF